MGESPKYRWISSMMVSINHLWEDSKKLKGLRWIR